MATFDAVLQRFEACVKRLEQIEGTVRAAQSSAPAAPALHGKSAGPVTPASPSSAAYAAYFDAHVQPFLSTCTQIGGDIEKIGRIAATAFEFVGTAVAAASQCTKPSDADLREFVEPLSKAIQEAHALQDNRSKAYNHQAGFAEALPALFWIAAPEKPQTHVQNAVEASTFYLNKVLTSASDEANKQFVKQIRNALNELKTYIKTNHPTGLSWSSSGKSIKQFSSGSAPAAPPCAPPPPAPAAPAPAAPASSSTTAPTLTGMAAVFAQINKGGDITKGLSKVTNDMKSKNRSPEERSGLVSDVPKKAAAPSRQQSKGSAATKPPSITHNQGKWFIENYVNAGVVELPAGEVQLNHTVYIYKCEGSTIKIGARVKAICMDNCKKSALIFGDVVSTVEIVNCQSVEVGTTGSAPSIAIDKTHGCQLVLSEECVKRDPSIVTSNISEVNIRVPGPTEKSDPVEIPVPEQFITKISGNRGDYKLNTQQVSHG